MWFKKVKDEFLLRIYVQPGAKKTEISGLYGDSLKVRLLSPPIEGRANKELVHFIAKIFNIPKTQVILKKGQHSRKKIIEIHGSRITPQSVVVL